MYKIIERKKIWFSLSLVAIIAGLIFIFLGGLKLGIDFTGGTMLQVAFSSSRPANSEIISAVNTLNLGQVKVQTAGESEAVLRLKNINNEERNFLLGVLTEKFGPVEEKNFDSVGPTIGQELKSKAFIAVALVLAAIIVYIAWAFRKISFSKISSWLFGVNAIIALVHDLLITLGLFAFLGYFFGVEIDIYFVTALLTILGFSVHDTIVVFDRVREGIAKRESESFDEILNQSINQTIIRSLNTSLTTLFVLLSLFLFGGESIRFFVLALMTGVIVGTYSSIFIASPLLSVWYHRR